MIRVRHLHISPGHPYFGHKNKPPGTHPLGESDHIEWVAGRGIVGDRFFDYKPEFEVQAVRFAGVEECRPCFWMNQAVQPPDAEASLKGRGGLRARILSSGCLRKKT